MAQPCGKLNNKQLNLGIQEYLNRQRSIQRGSQIAININALQEDLAKRYNCILPINPELSALVSSTIDKRNAYLLATSKSGKGGIKFVLVDTPLLLDQANPAETLTKRTGFEDTETTRQEVVEIPALPLPSRQSDLPDLPSRKYPRTNIAKPADMSAFYFPGVSYKNCTPDLKCPEHMACDLDRNKCLSTDILPALSWMNWKGIRVTGSGKKLIEFLLSQGIPMNEILAKQVPTTYNIDEYIDFLQAGTASPIQAISATPARKAAIQINEIPAVFSDTIQVRGFTLSTKGWPIGLTMIPDFLKQSDQVALLRRISGLLGNKHSLQFIGGVDSPPVLQCLAKFFYEHNFVNNYPNRITISRYLPGQGMSKRDETAPVVILSLGSPVVANFADKTRSIQIPLIPGSILIMDNPRCTYEISAQMTDTYSIPGLQNQDWKRGEYISVKFAHR